MRSPARDERGVVAVEFALVLPLMLALILGAIEFGDRYRSAALYNNAALVAARSYALNNTAATATAAARNAGIPNTVTPTYSFKFDSGTAASSCAADASGVYPNITVTITRTGVPALTPVGHLLPGVPSTHTITGKAVTRCAV